MLAAWSSSRRWFCDRLKLRAPSKFFLAFRLSLVERIQRALEQIGDVELVTHVNLLFYRAIDEFTKGDSQVAE